MIKSQWDIISLRLTVKLADELVDICSTKLFSAEHEYEPASKNVKLKMVRELVRVKLSTNVFISIRGLARSTVALPLLQSILGIGEPNA